MIPNRQKKRLPSVKGRKPSLSFQPPVTAYSGACAFHMDSPNAGTHVSPYSHLAYPARLLGCGSGVIFGSTLLIPGSHHLPARWDVRVRPTVSVTAFAFGFMHMLLYRETGDPSRFFWWLVLFDLPVFTKRDRAKRSLGRSKIGFYYVPNRVIFRFSYILR